MNLAGLPPCVLVQGDSAAWTTTAAEHPSSAGWVLTTTFRATTGTATAIVAVGQPDGSHRSTLTAAQSTALVAGPNAWEMRFTSGLEAKTALPGRTMVNPSLASAPPGNVLTPAEEYLAALIALGPSVMANGYAEMKVDGAEAVYMSRDEYRRELKAARQDVLNEQAARPRCDGKTGSGRLILTKFVTPRI